MNFNHGSLFNGIGGFQLAAYRIGWNNIFSCEIDDWCNRVTKKHFPDCIQHGDITKTDFTVYRGSIDILTGGVPCQPFSKAGKMQGEEDERYLWHEYIRCLRETKPRWFVAENVSGLLSTGGGAAYEKIILSMEAEGYETLALYMPACAVGAYHIRQRIWIIGHTAVEYDTNAQRRELGKISEPVKTKGTQNSAELSGDAFGLHWFEAISGIHRIYNGLSRRLDGRRNKALGNAIVPQAALEIFKAINICNS